MAALGGCWRRRSASPWSSSSGRRARRSCSRYPARTPSASHRVRRLRQFRRLFATAYLASFRITAGVRSWWRSLGLGISLLLAVLADRIVRGASVYKTILIGPYAVAPAVAGVLWLFLFSAALGVVAYALQRRRRLELSAQRRPGDDADRHRRRVEADLLQLPVLPGRPAVDSEVADRGGGDRRRGPWRRFWDIVFPLLSPTTFFLLVINIVYAFFDTFGIVDAPTQGGPGQATKILVYKVYNDGFKRPGPRRLGGAVGGADGHRHRPDRRPVPLHREEGAATDDREPAHPDRSLSHLVVIARPAHRRLPGLHGVRRLDPRRGHLQAPMPLCPATTCSRTTSRC